MEQLLQKAATKEMMWQAVQNKVSEHAAFVDEHANGVRVATFLQGSQNYDMADEESDVDTKSLVVPRFRDLVLTNKRESHTLVLPNNEHADVKDVQEMMLCWRKQNVNFVEVLYSRWYDTPELYDWFYDALFVRREELAHYSRWYTLMATCGHMEEKYAKLFHKGQARAAVVDKFGYDPKQLCHQLRLKRFLEMYFDDYPYRECLLPDNKDYLLAVKRGYHNLEGAKKVAEETRAWMLKFREDMMAKLGKPDRNEKLDKELDDLTVELYKDVVKYGEY